MIDLTKLKEASTSSTEELMILQRIYQEVREGVWMIYADGRVDLNTEARIIAGVPPNTAYEDMGWENWHVVGEDGKRLAGEEEALLARCLRGEVIRDEVLHVSNPWRSHYTLLIRYATPVYIGSKVIGAIAFYGEV